MNDNTARPPCASAQSTQSNYAQEQASNHPNPEADWTCVAPPERGQPQWSSLPWIIKRAAPREQFNPKLNRFRHIATPEELHHLANGADGAATSLIQGIGVVGKLLVHTKSNELKASDFHDLGDFLTTVSETANALFNLADTARNAED